MSEEYQVIAISGFQVIGDKYYSKVFNNLGEAHKLKKQLEDSPDKEEIQTVKRKR